MEKQPAADRTQWERERESGTNNKNIAAVVSNHQHCWPFIFHQWTIAGKETPLAITSRSQQNKTTKNMEVLRRNKDKQENTMQGKQDNYIVRNTAKEQKRGKA